MEIQEISKKLSQKFRANIRVTEDGKIKRLFNYSLTENNNWKLFTPDKNNVGKIAEFDLDESSYPEIYNDYRKISEEVTEVVQQDYKPWLVLGSLVLCKIKTILASGDIDVLPVDESLNEVEVSNTHFSLLLKDKVMKEEYSVGDLLYLIVRDIKKIGNSTSVKFSRRDSRLVMELMTQELTNEQDTNFEVVKCARIPGSGSRVIIKGDVVRYIPLLDKVKSKINNESIQLIRYSEFTPIQIVETLVELRNQIENIEFEFDHLNTEHMCRENIVRLYVTKQAKDSLFKGKRISQLQYLTEWKYWIEEAKDEYDDLNINTDLNNLDPMFMREDGGITINDLAMKNYIQAYARYNKFNIKELYTQLTERPNEVTKLTRNEVDYFIDLFNQYEVISDN